MPRQSVFDMSYGNPSASIVLIQMVDDHDLGGIESEAAEIKKLTDADFHLECVSKSIPTCIMQEVCGYRPDGQRPENGQPAYHSG